MLDGKANDRSLWFLVLGSVTPSLERQLLARYKFCGVTIQIKPLQQNVQIVLYICKDFTKRKWIFLGIFMYFC